MQQVAIVQCGHWSVFWPQCQHLKGICVIELFPSAVLFWVLDDYMSKFNLWKSYAHCEPFGLGKGYLANLLHTAIFFFRIIKSWSKEINLWTKVISWTKFHSATFPTFYSGVAKYISTKFVMHKQLKWRFFCPNNHEVLIREFNLKHSS